MLYKTFYKETDSVNLSAVIFNYYPSQCLDLIYNHPNRHEKLPYKFIETIKTLKFSLYDQ